MYKIVSSCFLACTAFATVNEPLRCEFFTGYRNDRIHWHLQLPDAESVQSYGELNRDVQFWENGLVFKAIHRDLAFFLRGVYGAFGRGNTFQRFSYLPFTSEEPQFEYATSGWSADVEGYFGYAINLTADRLYKVILTPLIGYSAYFEKLKRANPVSITEIPAAFFPTLPSVFSLVWNGFFFGANFLIEPGGRLILNAGYSYNLMHNRVKTITQYTYESVTTTQSIRTNANGNPGQSGWAQLDFLLPKLWRIGIGGNIHYFTTRVVEATVDPAPDQKFKLRWTSFAGWLQVSREI